MIETASFVIVVLTGIYFVSLAVMSNVYPGTAAKYLFGFASSAMTHYLELSVRFLVGAAFLAKAPSMRFEQVFDMFGWVLILTTAVLALVPWTLHNRLAKWSVPYAVRHLRLFGLSSFVIGLIVLFSVFARSA